MRTLRTSAICLVAATAVAQEIRPDAGELTHLRAAFADWRPDACAVLIAVVDDGEPAILCHGSDTSGEPARPHTCVPIASLARLLIADAIHVGRDGGLDAPAGVAVGGTEPTIRDLVQGGDSDARLLPDYWDWRTDSEPVTLATLLACAEVAAEARFTFERRRAGMADLMLVGQSVLGAAGDDWSSFLRVTLAPRVSGLDPRDAGELDDDAWARLSTASTLPRHAEPAALRLMVTGRDLANWWRWRLLAPMPLWEGSRMGHRGKATRRPEVERWEFEDFGNRPVKTLAVAYPQSRAGILCVSVGTPKWIPGQDDALTDAFEADLFGELAPPVRRGIGGRVGFRGPNTPLARWVGRTWVAEGTSPPCVLRVENATRKGLRLEFGGRTFPSVQAAREGKATRVVLSIDDSEGGVLWLVPQPGGDDPKRMVAVLVEWTPRSTVPHLLELVAEDER